RFLVLDPEKGYIEDVRQSIPVNEALVGVSLSAVVTKAERVKLEWNWFPTEVAEIPFEIAAHDEMAGRILSPAKNGFLWESSEEILLPGMDVIPAIRMVAPPQAGRVFVAAAIILAGGLGMVVVRKRFSQLSVWAMIFGLLLLAVGMGMNRKSAVFPSTEMDVENIVGGVLNNIYHAFDYRDESAIYDTLEKSIEGPLLERVYLEIKEGLELENRGGPRVKISGIDLREAEMTNQSGTDRWFTVKADWIAVGDVNHWGHKHLRTNRYSANIRFSGDPDLPWKVSELELLEEERTKQVYRQQLPTE
ncbi:MAG: hypothetical protein AAF226_07465, partial [Verrucomicrobiota bacterium]